MTKLPSYQITKITSKQVTKVISYQVTKLPISNPLFPERLADGKRPFKKIACNGTHTHTHGHRDSETESAHWADSVKRNKNIGFFCNTGAKVYTTFF